MSLSLNIEYLSEFDQEVKGLEPLVSLFFKLACESVISEFTGVQMFVLVNSEGKTKWEIFRTVWPFIDVLHKDVFYFLRTLVKNYLL